MPCVLAVLLGSGLRVSEALGLDQEQYTGKGFARVQVKGGMVRDFVPLHRDAREVLDDWLEERKDEATPIFLTRTGRRMSRREAAASIGRIAAQVNGRVSDEEKIEVSPWICSHDTGHMWEAISPQPVLTWFMRLQKEL